MLLRFVKKIIDLKNVFVATDDERISKVVKYHGYNCIMTSENCLTGTDRIAEVAKQIKSDIYINVQGDEPMLDPKDIIKIVDEKKKNFDYVVNGFTEIYKNENPSNINIPKVIFDDNKTLIYMSRNLLPGF